MTSRRSPSATAMGAEGDAHLAGIGGQLGNRPRRHGAIGGQDEVVVLDADDLDVAHGPPVHAADRSAARLVVMAEIPSVAHHLVVAPMDRDVVVAAGPEVSTFLQGQLSQDVEALPVGGSAWSFLLQPQGKVDAWLRLTRLAEDRILLDVDGGFGPSVIARLERFKLRTKVEMDALHWRALAVRGPGAAALLAPTEQEEGDAAVTVDAGWPGVEGVDVLGPADAVVAPADAEPVPAAQLEALRIALGVPKVGAELTEATIPAEAGQWVIDASVSFTKGCFTGQELVARIDSRGGNVPRRILGLVVVDDVSGGGDGVPAGAALIVDGKDKEVGTVTSSAGGVALASVARSVDPPTPVTAVWDGGSAAAEIRDLPLTPG